MNVEELIAIINTESIESFIPLKDIPDEKTRLDYQARMKDDFYHFPYHYQSFQKAYPHLNPDWVYCNRGISPLYYWEEDTGILLKILVELEGLKVGEASGSKAVEDVVLKELVRCKEDVQEANYSFLLRNLNGQMKMEYLNTLLEENRQIKDLFSLFQACYVSTDFGAAVISRENLKRVMDSMTDKEQEDLQVRKQELPDVLTVYRGEGMKSTSYENAYSWSLDANAALFYAVRFGERQSRILVAEVRKEDILCFGSDGDSEVLILPESITLQEIYQQEELPKLSAKLEQYGILSRIYRDALQENHVEGHDSMHALRTLLLAEMIYDKRHPEVPFGRNHHILAQAAVYHDMGRSLEGAEVQHSKASAKCFRNSLYGKMSDAAVVEFLIRFHETEQPIFEHMLKQTFPGREKMIQELLAILQDADALDRLRFGYRSPDSLDFHRLRLPESRELVLASRLLNEGLTNPELLWGMEEEVEKMHMELE